MKIFLDIDGVMVHAIPNLKVALENDKFYKFSTKAIDKLNSLLNPGDEIILSTTHRFRFRVAEWKEVFKSRGIEIENLSMIALPVNILNRKDEIMYWIAERDLEAAEILIIDDCKSLNALPDEYKERLMLTNGYVGLE